MSCTKAKCHCDNALPGCSRCAKRGFTCIYQQSMNRSNRSLEGSRTSSNSSKELPLLELVAYSSPAENYGEILGLADEGLFQTQALLDDRSLPIEEHLPHITYPSPVPTHCYSRCQNTDAMFSDQFSRVDFGDCLAFSTLAYQPILRAPRAFKARTVKYRPLYLNRKYIICTLTAYPPMLLQGRSPPFLHHHTLLKMSCQDEGGAQSPFLKPLATCSGITAMWSVKNANNSTFIWQSIRTEQERILEEVCTT